MTSEEESGREEHKIDMSLADLLHGCAKSAMQVGEPDVGTRRRPTGGRESRDTKDRAIMNQLEELDEWQSAEDVYDDVMENEDINVNIRQVRYRLNELADDGLIRRRNNPEDRRQNQYRM